MSLVGRGGMAWALGCGFGLAVAAWAGSAAAQVKQTDAVNTPLPQPVSQAEASLVNDSWAWNANTMVKRDHAGTNLNPAIRYGDYYARRPSRSSSCRLGQCVDPCAGVTCPGAGICSLGVCSSPHGNGGSGGRGGLSFGGTSAAGAASGGMAAAASAGAAQAGVANLGGADDPGNSDQGGAVAAGGNGNAAGHDHAAGTSNAAGGVVDTGGMSSRGGAFAMSGAGAGSSASEAANSSSCGCAVPGQETPSRALPVLGLILGAALIRRRRRQSFTGA